MIVRPVADGVEVLAPAKLNLFLEILGRRPDDYHEIETLMVAVDLYDNAFSYLQMGYASAIAWTLFLIIAVLTALAFWASKGRVHYGGGT